MQLADTLVLRCYHLPVYDWTPLSQDPCWRCSVICADWLCRTRQTITACVHSSRLSQKTTGFIIAWIGRLKSWENDSEGSGCCKCWEWSLYHDPLRHSPRLTICPPLFKKMFFIKNVFHYLVLKFLFWLCKVLGPTTLTLFARGSFCRFWQKWQKMSRCWKC